MSAQLHRWHSEQPLTLAEALTACAGFLEGAVALLYSPMWCRLARLWRTEVETVAPEGKVDRRAFDRWAEVYEARVFAERAELRWLHQENGSGVAVVLSEDPILGLDERFAHQKIDVIELDGSRTLHYLLWGTIDHQAPKFSGWVRMQSARIGYLWVPLDMDQPAHGKGRRVAVRAREYFAELADANVGVIEERLLGLEVLGRG